VSLLPCTAPTHSNEDYQDYCAPPIYMLHMRCMIYI
jgi:hypothetical protein